MRKKLEEYFDRLWPINRSLTGNGNRESLKILSEIVDLNIQEISSGQSCYDWNIPAEWNIKEAWIKDSAGNVIVDFNQNNLHILGYSTPIHATLSWKELEPHLYSLPKHPDWVPYKTSYYKKRWGFCISHNQLLTLDKSDTYEVYIDSQLDENGSMTIGEAFIRGKGDKEILLSTYICHPSMANNELSGPLVTAFLFEKLKQKKRLTYSYRFLFLPETIGAIYKLSELGEHWKKNLHAGFVVNCIGDNGDFTYKKSRQGNSITDRAAELILSQSEEKFNLIDYFPLGSDERQYCSPGFNLPIGSLMRSMYSTYPEYHTSADNKSFISFEALEQSIDKYLEIIELIEKNQYYQNLFPFGEPQLGKRGLYPTISTNKKDRFVEAIIWLLNLSDGNHDVIDISKRSGIPVKDLYPAIDKLIANELIIPSV